MTPPRIYADFQNADPHGRLRLNTNGTVQDLASNNVTLSEGLHLSLYTDDADEHGAPGELFANGIVSYSTEERCWVAIIDWGAIAHVSTGSSLNGTATKVRTRI